MRFVEAEVCRVFNGSLFAEADKPRKLAEIAK